MRLNLQFDIPPRSLSKHASDKAPIIWRITSVSSPNNYLISDVIHLNCFTAIIFPYLGAGDSSASLNSFLDDELSNAPKARNRVMYLSILSVE